MPPQRKRSRSTSQSASPQKLRAVSPEELELWSDGDSDSTEADPQPQDLDEPWHYTFRPGDAVYVRTVGGNWFLGHVSGQTTRKGQTREKEGLFYPVVFNNKIRKYFAPLNGEIKPATPYIERLLKDAGIMP